MSSDQKQRDIPVYSKEDKLCKKLKVLAESGKVSIQGPERRDRVDGLPSHTANLNPFEPILNRLSIVLSDRVPLKKDCLLKHFLLPILHSIKTPSQKQTEVSLQKGRRMSGKPSAEVEFTLGM
jgi:hypothetical protein